MIPGAMHSIDEAWNRLHPDRICASHRTIRLVFEPKIAGRIRFNDSEVEPDDSIPDGVFEMHSTAGRVERIALGNFPEESV